MKARTIESGRQESRLVSGKRQKTRQLQLAFMSEGGGEAPKLDVQGTEPPAWTWRRSWAVTSARFAGS